MAYSFNEEEKQFAKRKWEISVQKSRIYFISVVSLNPECTLPRNNSTTSLKARFLCLESRFEISLSCSFSFRRISSAGLLRTEDTSNQQCFYESHMILKEPSN